jgi:hypothetical protein
MINMKPEETKWLAIVLVVVILVAGILVAGSQGWLSQGNKVIKGPNSTTTISVGGIYTSTQVLRIGAGYINLNLIGTPNTSVATTYTIYEGSSLNGQPSIETGTTSAAGLTTSTSANGVIPGPYVVVYGDNVHYLLTYAVGQVTAGVQATPIGALVVNYTTPTVTAGNGVTAYPTASNAIFHNVVASEGLTQPVLEIKSGSQSTGVAMGSLVVVTYNSAAVNGGSQLSLGCAGETSAPAAMLPTPTYVNGQNQQVGFIIPQLNHNQVLLCSPTITTTSGFAANSFVGIEDYPITNYNLNGVWYPNVVTNPSTSAGTPIIAGQGSSYAYQLTYGS